MSSNASQSNPTIVKRSELNELIRSIITVVNESFVRAEEAGQKNNQRLIVIDLGNGDVVWTTQMDTLDGAFDQIQQSTTDDSNQISYTASIKDDGFWMLKGSNGKAYMLMDIESTNPIVKHIKTKFSLQDKLCKVNTTEGLTENNGKNRIVPEGTIQLYKGLAKDEAINFAKMHWYIYGVTLDDKGVWNFTVKTRRGEIPCCKAGLYRQVPALLNRLPDNQEHLLVGMEIVHDLDSDIIEPSTDKTPMGEMTGTGAVGAISTPMAFSKRKIKEASPGQSADPTKEEMVEYLEAVYSGLLDRESFDNDAEPAIYWFANFYHGGQSSNLYSALSTSPFNPGPMARGPQKDSIEDDMFQTLVLRFVGGKQINEGDETDAVNAMWDGSDDELKQYRKSKSNKPRNKTSKPTSQKKGKAIVKGKEIPLNESFGRIQKIYKDRQGGVDVYWIDNKDTGGKTFIKPENLNQYLRQGAEIVDLNDSDRVDEMTTTGDVSGYNIPSAFARKGGSERGVAGSAALGYTLTPIGKKEMQRSGDKLLENDGRKQRCSKCKELKSVDSHGYIEGWECAECRNKS